MDVRTCFMTKASLRWCRLSAPNERVDTGSDAFTDVVGNVPRDNLSVRMLEIPLRRVDAVIVPTRFPTPAESLFLLPLFRVPESHVRPLWPKRFGKIPAMS